MTINFQRSELVGLLGALTPYMTGFASLGIRTKDEMLEMFAYTDNESALVRTPCKSAEAQEWKYIDGSTLQELVKFADESHISRKNICVMFDYLLFSRLNNLSQNTFASITTKGYS